MSVRHKRRGKGCWYFDGGGRAHARTLRVLGFACKAEVEKVYILVSGIRKISVPKRSRLEPDTIKQILTASGFHEDEYLDAWKIKKSVKLECPKQGSAVADAK